MYKRTIGDLDTLEAQQAMQAWELSKVPTQVLKDELGSREDLRVEVVTHYTSGSPKGKVIMVDGIDIPEQHDVCKHDREMGYCEVEGCSGSY